MKKVEATITIKTTPAKVISAFTEPESLKGWWHVEKSLIEKRPGGLYILNWEISGNGIGYVSSGIIKEYQEDKVLIIDKSAYMKPDKSILGPMTFTVRAAEKDDGTEVYICQEGYQEGGDWDWYYDAVKQAWPIAIQKLKEYLET